MISFASISNKGTREINEDSLSSTLCEDSAFFAVADGLGGHGLGDIASQCVVRTAAAFFKEHSFCNEFLSDVFNACQSTLMQTRREMHVIDEMKTTLVACHINATHVQWAHVGDSRLYLFKNKRLEERTKDHSVPQLLVYAGDIKEKDIRFHPDRNCLLKVMGTPWDKPEYEISQPYQRGKPLALLLCTDGFWELIDEKQMQKCLKKAKNAEQWAESMHEIVKKNGTDKEMDNYTAVCIWCD